MITTSNNNNQRYLVRVTLNSKADKPVALISGSNWNLECWFLWREENRRTRRKTLGAGTRTNNKLNPHVTPGPGIEPGPQRWEASALTTAPSLLPFTAAFTFTPNITLAGGRQIARVYKENFTACRVSILPGTT